METNRNIMLWTILFTASFIVSLLIYSPDAIDQYRFALIGISWLVYMTGTFLSIIALTSLPFVKAMMQGEDSEYNPIERRWAIVLISAIVIGNAIYMGMTVTNLLINGYPA